MEAQLNLADYCHELTKEQTKKLFHLFKNVLPMYNTYMYFAKRTDRTERVKRFTAISKSRTVLTLQNINAYMLRIGKQKLFPDINAKSSEKTDIRGSLELYKYLMSDAKTGRFCDDMKY